MCMLQGDVIAKDLVVSLPQDIQALVLLHNGNANHNITGAYFKLKINNKINSTNMLHS